jgi:hypothetical protein
MLKRLVIALLSLRQGSAVSFSDDLFDDGVEADIEVSFGGHRCVVFSVKSLPG